MERLFFGRPPRGAEITRPPGEPFGLPGSQGSLTAAATASFLYCQLCKCILHSAGKEKGYELVSVLPYNAFFVRREDYPRFQIASNAPDVLRTSLGGITYLFSGYDGTIFLRGCCKLPWHGVDLKEPKVQHLPRCLRRYPGHYTGFHKTVFALYLLVADPRRFMREIRKRASRLIGSPGTRPRGTSGPAS